MRILLIEDDQIIGESIKQILEFKNFVVDWFEDGESCFLALNKNIFDAIVLDLNLPDLNGEKIIENLRSKNNNVPIIVISARNSIDERVSILDLGADDFLTKPFQSNELIARLKSVHRRNKGINSRMLESNEIKIDISKNLAFYRDSLIDLTPKEFMILKNLIENKNKTISKSHLENLLYNLNQEIESNALEVHIHNIRKKTNKKIIKTVRGFDYKI